MKKILVVNETDLRIIKEISDYHREVSKICIVNTIRPLHADSKDYLDDLIIIFELECTTRYSGWHKKEHNLTDDLILRLNNYFESEDFKKIKYERENDLEKFLDDIKES